MSSSKYMFVIVGKNEPLYEISHGVQSEQDEDMIIYDHFILHSSLDMIERAQFSTQNMYLKTVDRFNELSVSAFLCAQDVKFMLLHAGKSDDSIKNFFTDVYELYVRLAMNPFYDYDTPILSSNFDKRVKLSAQRHLS
ncbi:unnamed protein product [Heterosigma akashiwo]|mmetsp:Transcript_13133/g.18295  ORF Transcript_13133/g.18295 Transcript_13133/m.18295 type:complete len:138 (+) Transcript_13133:103-516(+)|eukprot:CAMPEP_0194570118 /NCGR_PEP_ID=MMETSP0292-20121207/7560_1 /TAXON_ID=39354 /ORGANISM="Heterosigma akashiwo, Strain CCMP2393" /LENGTH=137 /DNA_ID=CAMNT_0039420501 /DNA_START=98 /DNA_END=511 /DNA_ORIENTATION=-